MLQVRNVPEDIHRRLKSRAAQAGTSLSEYVLVELKRMAELPTFDELRARLARLTPVKLRPSAAEIIRQERDSH